MGEILKGLRCYFDKALPAILLYKSERRQYKEAISVDVSPSTVYVLNIYCASLVCLSFYARSQLFSWENLLRFLCFK